MESPILVKSDDSFPSSFEVALGNSRATLQVNETNGRVLGVRDHDSSLNVLPVFVNRLRSRRIGIRGMDLQSRVLLST